MNRAMRRAQKHNKPRRVVLNRKPGTLLFSSELQDMILSEIQAVNAFKGGWAEPWHFDFLVEGEELAMLELYAQEMADFWPRQSVQAYRNAIERCAAWKRAAVSEARAQREAA